MLNVQSIVSEIECGGCFSDGMTIGLVKLAMLPSVVVDMCGESMTIERMDRLLFLSFFDACATENKYRRAANGEIGVVFCGCATRSHESVGGRSSLVDIAGSTSRGSASRTVFDKQCHSRGIAVALGSGSLAAASSH